MDSNHFAVHLNLTQHCKSTVVSESEVTQSCPTLYDPWTVAHQAPPSMEFSRQEYWSGLPFPSPRDLPDAEIEPGSPALQADALPSEPQGSSKQVLLTQFSVHFQGVLSTRPH